MGAKSIPRKGTFSVNTDVALHVWRASAVRLVLLVIAASGLLSWGSAIYTDRTLTGLTLISWVYLGVYGTLVLLALLPRIDYRWRAWGLVVLAYINAVASFAKLGLVGSGRLYLLVIPIFAILLLGWRSGILTTLLSLVVYYATVHLITNYQFGEWDRLLENPALLNRWGEAGAAMVTFLLAVLAMLASFQRLVRHTLAAQRDTGQALERTAQTLQQRLNFERLISNISTKFINLGPSEIDAGIQHALEAIGQFAGADRSYIFEFTEGQRCMTNSHEWCAAGIEPQSQRIQEQPTEVTPWTIERIKRLEVVQVPRVASLPDEAALDQKEFQAQSVQSLICIPMVYQGEAIGLIGFDTVRRERDWSEDDVALLRVVGEMIVNALMHQRALAAEEAQRRFMDQAQQTALLEERGRLARELHDSVTQSLYSVTLYAEAAARLFSAGDTQTAVEHLHELRDTSKEALQEMRLLIYELRPPVLETGGLAGAVQARLDAVEARAGLNAEFQVDGTDRLPAAVQAELYHIAREALNNLLKHARAHCVHVTLSFQEAQTILEIYDDGVGFNPGEAQASGGLGISGMKERAQRIGAHLEIHSAPGEGTTVRVIAINNGRG